MIPIISISAFLQNDISLLTSPIDNAYKLKLLDQSLCKKYQLTCGVVTKTEPSG